MFCTCKLTQSHTTFFCSTQLFWSSVLTWGPRKLFGLTYIRLYPQYIIATYGYSQTCHVWKICSKWVYIHEACTTSKCPAALTLWATLVVLITQFVGCNTHLTADSKLVAWLTEKWIANRCTLSYPKFQNFLGGAFSQTPLQGLASHTAYYHQIFFSTLQHPHKCITPALYFAWPMLFTLLLPQQKFAPEPPVSKR